MEEAGTSTGDDRPICKLCNAQPRRYTCPKCEIPYCSVDCYKSVEHLECSENFYRHCVETELKSQEQDPEARRKMIDILKRINRSDLESQDSFLYDNDDQDKSNDFLDSFGSDDDMKAGSSIWPDINETDRILDPIDSDDDQDVPDLANRLESVNLNNADELWGVLTDSERQEFEATIRNGEVTKFLPIWIPWWTKRLSKPPIVEEVSDNDETKANQIDECPPIIQVPVINEIAKSSPFVQFNLLNVLHAYVYMVLHCNGDHQQSPRESISVFLRLSSNMRSNKVFHDSQEAIESVKQNSIDCESLPGDEEAMAAAKNAVNHITNGPENLSQNFYLSAALSDLHRLFTSAKSETCNFLITDRSFTNKFRTGVPETELTKKTLQLCTKKIEYYLSWVKSHGTRVFVKYL